MRLNVIHVSRYAPVVPSLWVDTSGVKPVLKAYVNGRYQTLSEEIPAGILTEDMIVNSLDSDAVDMPLSAAQGKILKSLLDEKQGALTPGTGIEITDDNTINITLDTTVFKVVPSLPDSPASGDENKIHLVPSENTGESNSYKEYLWVNNEWEEIGTYISTVDLTPYLTKEDAEKTYQTITDSSLQTQDKTVVGGINEVSAGLKEVVKPYVINLTNLLSAQDSESISTAIGGIDNLNGTVQKNQVIFGTLANGTVAVSIRVLGNQTTLTYFVDSVVGLTVNEVIITNTSGTLTKTVNTHAVLTENMVVNNLESDETTLPLSAAQGKTLNEKILNSGKVYVIDGTTLFSTEGNPTSEQISEAIGGWDNLVNAIQNNYIVIFSFSVSDDTRTILLGSCAVNDNTIYIDCRSGVVLNSLIITNQSGTLSTRHNEIAMFNTDDNYEELQTSNKTILGAINEVNMLVESKADSQDITNAINALDSSGQTVSTGEVISSVSQENGVISVSKKTLTSDDIPELPQSKITDLSTDLAAKQDTLTAGTGIEITPENQINVTLDTTVFKVVSALPDSPAAGDENKIHLVPAESTEEGNIYAEYVFVNSKWEEFGTYRSEVDLTPYLKKVDAKATYQKINDSTLATNAKTVVGAINENTGNVTRIDRAVGNPVVEEVDLTQPTVTNKYFNANTGAISNSNSFNVKVIQLSRGDIVYIKTMSSPGVSPIIIIDSEYNAVGERIAGENVNKTYSLVAKTDCLAALSYNTLYDYSAYIIKSPFNTAISDNSYMQYLHKVYEKYGAVYNEETGYWELNGLTDLTEEEMYDIWLWTHNIINQPDLAQAFAGAPIRTTLPHPNCGIYRPGPLTMLNQAALSCSYLEVFHITSIPDGRIPINGSWANACHNAFNSCTRLREIKDILDVPWGSGAIFSAAFNLCSKLSKVRIKNLLQNVSFEHSPLLSYESLNYIVASAANTSAITITVHPTTYSYLTGTVQPTEEVGGTSEEWQALVTTAQGKRISFAVPE